MKNSNALPSLSGSLRAFHEDEDGLESLQVVMILFIAALILLFLAKMFPGVTEKVKKNVQNLLNTSEPDGTVN